jgi:hypothetical protein
MAEYEYRLEHKPAGGRVSQTAERLNALAEEGWEPVMMSGGEELVILLRRPKRQAPPGQAAVSPGQG